MPGQLLQSFRDLTSVGVVISLWLLHGTTLYAQELAEAERLFELSLDELLNVEVVSVSKKPERAFTAPGTVYVIRRDEIERFGFRLFQEALRYVPSVYLYDPHSWVWGGQRGFVSNFSQTLLLINGREVNNLIAQEGFISRQFATHNIERIEVVASPGSALYGANALAGVINIITTDADPEYEGFEVSLEAGSFNTTALSLVFGHSFGDFKIKGSARQFNSDEQDFLDFVRDTVGYSAGWVDNNLAARLVTRYQNPSEARPLNVQVDYRSLYAGINYYYNRQSHGLEKLRWDYSDGEDNRSFALYYGGYNGKINERMRLKAEYQLTRSSLWGRYHAGLWPVSRLESTDNLEVFNFPAQVVTSTGDILRGPAEIKAFYPSFAHYLIDQGILDPNSITSSDIQRYFTHVYTNRNSRRSQRQRLDLLWSWDLSSTTGVDLGYVFDHTDYVGLAVTDAGFGLASTFDIPIDLSKRKDVYESVKHSAYAQLSHTVMQDRLWLNLGTRYDHQNHYGGTVTPRVGLVWQPRSSTILKLLYGEAFREPNVFELSSDPDLSPAELRSFEVNVSHSVGDIARFSVAAYHNTVTDFLSSVGSLIGTGVGSVEKQVVRGAEFRFNLKRNPFLAFASGAFLFNPEQTFVDNTTGLVETNAILGIPRTRVNGGISYRFLRNVSGSLLYRYVASYDALSGNRAISAPFRIGSASHLKATLQAVGFQVGEVAVDGFVTVNNLTNSRIFEANIRRSGPHVFLQDGRNIQMRLRFRN